MFPETHSVPLASHATTESGAARSVANDPAGRRNDHLSTMIVRRLATGQVADYASKRAKAHKVHVRFAARGLDAWVERLPPRFAEQLILLATRLEHGETIRLERNLLGRANGPALPSHGRSRPA